MGENVGEYERVWKGVAGGVNDFSGAKGGACHTTRGNVGEYGRVWCVRAKVCQCRASAPVTSLKPTIDTRNPHTILPIPSHSFPPTTR